MKIVSFHPWGTALRFLSLFLVSEVLSSVPVCGLQNLFPFPSAKSGLGGGPKLGGLVLSNAKVSQIEDDLIQAIEDLGENRLANSDTIQSLVSQLEESGQSIPQPAISPQIYGRWRLIHTDNANTASPIQRKAVDSSSFPIYQDITFNDKNQLIVSQVVKFNDNAELKVDALASTSAYPLQELTERKGDGTFLGLNILGVSIIGEEAKPDPNRPDSRIDFVFDEGNFQLGSDLSIPYPVPFRLPILRDAVKGWIDVTWLSDRLRISRGNKGTTFVLLKEQDDRQKKMKSN